MGHNMLHAFDSRPKSLYGGATWLAAGAYCRGIEKVKTEKNNGGASRVATAIEEKANVVEVNCSPNWLSFKKDFQNAVG